MDRPVGEERLERWNSHPRGRGGGKKSERRGVGITRILYKGLKRNIVFSFTLNFLK